jgi:hypothetical protein
MAKRFTETGKWTDKWYRALSPVHKLAWGYLTDNCDPAGVIDLDCELADFQIGSKVDWDVFIKAAGPRILKIARGKLWLTGFVAFQYGSLSPDCKPHRSVITTLERYGLLERVTQGLSNPLDTVQDKDKDQDKDKETDKEKDPEGGVGETKPVPELPPSIRTPEMTDAVGEWLKYKAERREQYKPTGLKAFYSHLSGSVAQHGEDVIISRIRKAMASGWKGWDHADSRGSPGRPADDPRGTKAAMNAYLNGS